MRRTTLLCTLALPFAATACVAPFSEMQGARLTDPGRPEITPFYSSVGMSVDGEREKIYNQYGVAVAARIGEKSDLRGKIERVTVDGEAGDGFTAISLGPKFSLREDRVALYLPVGVGVGGGLDVGKTLMTQPTVLFTFPVSKQFEFNPSAKLVLPLSEGDPTVAANLGFAIGRDIRRFALRPEIGVMKNPNGDGYAYHYSLGATFSAGK